MRHDSHITIGLLAVAALIVTSTPAQATTVSRCLSAKIKSVAASLSARTRCYANNAANPNADTLSACLDKASRNFLGNGNSTRGGFDSAENHLTCVTVGDEGAVDAAIAAYAASLDGQIGNAGTPSRCDAAKLKCIGKYVASVARCESAAANGDGSVDDECMAKAALKLSNGDSGCLDKVDEAANGCSVTDDATALEASADGFVGDALCTLDLIGTGGCPGAPVTPTPTPTVTATPTPTRTATPGAATPVPTPNPANDEAAQTCVNEINRYRATLGLRALTAWTSAETCADDEGYKDSLSGQAHSAFGQCGEWAQNECPGWGGPAEPMILSCLEVMWNEGPGTPYSAHGHYINMSNPGYSEVACGFYETPTGAVWAVQDFR